MDGDGGGYGVLLGVDDGDGSRARVDDVDFAASWGDGDSGGVVADGELAVAAEIDDVEDGDGVAGGVGDVGVFAVVGWVLGEVVGAAA